MNAHQPFEVKAGPYLLSVPTPEDYDDLVEGANDPEVARWTTVPYPYTRAHAAEFIAGEVAQTWQNGGAIWGIRKDGKLLGVISLDKRKFSLEVGFWLSHAARGKGVMNEVFPVVIDVAFGHFDAQRLQWRALAGHWASWRLAWKNGFTKEGTLRKADMYDGESVDLWIGSLLKGDPRTPRTAWDGPGAPAGVAPNPRDPEALVRQFHRVYGMPIKEDGASFDIEKSRLDMRMSLIIEECSELAGAVYGPAAADLILKAGQEAKQSDQRERDLVETADALADLTYVIYGMALEMGISLPAVLEQVQASNMSKLGEDGKPIYREDGKVLKGPGFFPPDVAKALQTPVGA